MADINTGGGTGIGGDANTGGGDLVGRDQEQGNARSRSSASQNSIVNVNRDQFDNLYTDIRLLEEAVSRDQFDNLYTDIRLLEEAVSRIKWEDFQRDDRIRRHDEDIKSHTEAISDLRQHNRDVQHKPAAGLLPETVITYGFMVLIMVIFVVGILFYLARG